MAFVKGGEGRKIEWRGKGEVVEAIPRASTLMVL